MVMAVFTLPSLNVVFKVIKDHFDPPKTITRDQVRARYDLVFAHDRVGRLADAQEFDHLRFRRAHFVPELLDELARAARRTVMVDGDDVVIRHAYSERRVTPLNLYLREPPRPRLPSPPSSTTATPSATSRPPTSFPGTCCSRTSASPATAASSSTTTTSSASSPSVACAALPARARPMRTR